MISPLSFDQLTLETERLRLTPMKAGDVDISKDVLCDPKVMRYVADAMSPEDVEEDMSNSVRRGAGGRIGLWVITSKDTNEKIGTSVLMPVPIDEDDYDWSLLVPEAYPPAHIEVGYLFVPAAWGQGFATEACTRLVRFAFEQTSLAEIVATADPDNFNSHNVLQKSGLQKIGTKRAYGYDDVLWFDLTRERWSAKHDAHA